MLSDKKSTLNDYNCQNLNKSDNNSCEDGKIYIELELITSVGVLKKTKRYPEGIPITFVQNLDFGDATINGVPVGHLELLSNQ